MSNERAFGRRTKTLRRAQSACDVANACNAADALSVEVLDVARRAVADIAQVAFSDFSTPKRLRQGLAPTRAYAYFGITWVITGRGSSTSIELPIYIAFFPRLLCLLSAGVTGSCHVTGTTFLTRRHDNPVLKLYNREHGVVFSGIGNT